MTHDEIIAMAREADIYADKQTVDPYDRRQIRDERFAALVAAAERGECACICDRFAERNMHPAECAAAIRARSTQSPSAQADIVSLSKARFAEIDALRGEYKTAIRTVQRVRDRLRVLGAPMPGTTSGGHKV